MRRILLKAGMILICVFLLAGCGEAVDESSLQVIEEEEVEIERESDSEDVTCIYVHVCGQVAQPGVYKLPQNSRIFEAIEAAGGITDDAQESGMNLAQMMEDGQQIYIPSVEEVKNQENSATIMEQDDGKINLNSATKEELMTLSGIGEVKAEAIIRYREEHGAFQSVEELTEIQGIKEGLFQKVKDQIKVE